MKPLFFGPAESQLFGVYHAARVTKTEDNRAVLICPPIGQEYIRTHWALRLFAGQLARKGIHVMRMDYAGVGDSARRISDIDKLSTWHENIVAALDQLGEISGVGGATVVGLRFGAPLAWQAALDFPDRIHSIVSWEPVANGKTHLDELRQLHARMLDFNDAKMTTPNDDKVEEIVGSVYARSLLQQIEAFRPDVAKLSQPHLVLQPDSKLVDLGTHESPWLTRELKIDDPYTWDRLPELETAWLVPATAKKLVSNIEDLFERLERFDLLPSVKPKVQDGTTHLTLPTSDLSIASNATAGV